MSDTPMLQVEIVTPERSVFSGQASEVLIPAWEGQMGIYPQHDAILALLRAGRCTVTTEGKILEFVVRRGFAEVGPDRVTILTEACDPKDSVDREAAKKQLEETEKALAALEDVYSIQYDQLREEEEHAQAKLGLR